MANNRLILLHVPTNNAICIGKRMGGEWYCGVGTTQEALDYFYEACWQEEPNYHSQDDFVLLLENNDQNWTRLEEITGYGAYKWPRKPEGGSDSVSPK